jgi:hypothetical protein
MYVSLDFIRVNNRFTRKIIHVKYIQIHVLKVRISIFIVCGTFSGTYLAIFKICFSMSIKMQIK